LEIFLFILFTHYLSFVLIICFSLYPLLLARHNLSPEDVNSTFLRNVCEFISDSRASYPIRENSLLYLHLIIFQSRLIYSCKYTFLQTQIYDPNNIPFLGTRSDILQNFCSIFPLIYFRNICLLTSATDILTGWVNKQFQTRCK
jgi:hypothetical protein